MSTYTIAELTTSGETLLAKRLLGKTVTFSKFSIGDGFYNGQFSDATALINELFGIDIQSYEVNSVGNEPALLFRSAFDDQTFGQDFIYREAGLWALDPDLPEGENEVLVAYVNYGDNAEKIINGAINAPITIQKKLEFVISMSSTQNINVYLNSSLEGFQVRNEKGKPKGYAPLDENGKVPSVHLGIPLLMSIPMMRELDPDELLNWTLAGQFETADNKPVLFEKVQAWFNGGQSINDPVPLSNVNNNIVTATIPCVRAQNGARIVHIDNMASIDTLFTNTGSAAYLVYDPTLSRVRLPRNNNFISGTDNSNYVNSYEFDRIVNIVGYVMGPGGRDYNGAITGTRTAAMGTGNASSAGEGTFNFNASRVVNTGTEVQPRNVRQLLYFKTS